MTATAARPAARPGVFTRLIADPTFPATASLTLLTVAVGVGFGRLFSEGPFLAPIVLSALVAHTVAWWCRNHEVSTGVSVAATMGAVGVVAAWTLFGETTAYGIPIPLTLKTMGEALAQARETYRVVKAPTPAIDGFVLALALAVGIAAFMADWAAFRLATAIEALIPAFSLFAFAAALGFGRYRTFSFVTFGASALTFLVVSNMTTRTRLAWFGGRPAHGPGTVMRSAALIGAAAIVAGLVIGPEVPTGEPLISIRNKGKAGPSSRTTISPMVDLQGRLVERADIEVFTVKSDQAARWRLTSLDSFNGSIWSSNATYRPARGGLTAEARIAAIVPKLEATQEFRIRALDSIWLPAAFRPVRVSGIDGASYNADTASLITEDETTNGYTYVVESAVPQFTPEMLEGATTPAPPDITERYLALPQLPPRVTRLAREIVANARTPYRQAKVLQDFFQSGQFTYDLGFQQGHGSSALESFLFRTKRGYCEQFAGAYAVLARAAGLPARVAVGFTPGELRGDTYHVRDEHAHAWPEVYIHGFGWIAFEPTPGRGDRHTQSYTGLPESQDTSGPETTATTLAPPTTLDPNAETPSTTPPDVAFPEGSEPGAGEEADKSRLDEAVKVVGVLVGLWVVLVPLLHLHRIRRRRAATEAADRVLAAWAEASEVLAQAGVRRKPAETMLEFSTRAPASAGLQQDAAIAFRALGHDATLATYAPDAGGLAHDAGERAAVSAQTVSRAITGQVPVFERVRWWLDPRPLWREFRSRPRARP
ncbi:MAG TPA: DUF3488 and transglutaminase-like domain-containing protein [Acidimicrobiales bacterium]